MQNKIILAGFKRLFTMVFAAAAVTGCASGTTSPGVLEELWYYASSSSVQWKGSVDGVDFEIESRAVKGEAGVTLATLVRGPQSFDYFVEVEMPRDGRETMCLVTRAPKGSLAGYIGARTPVWNGWNSSPPKDSVMFTSVADYSDHEVHTGQLGDAVDSLVLKLQRIR